MNATRLIAFLAFVLAAMTGFQSSSERKPRLEVQAVSTGSVGLIVERSGTVIPWARYLHGQETPTNITDDPRTWPESWGEADREAESCTSTGKNRGGTKKNPTNCKCLNRCIRHGLVPGVPEFSQRHGDPRCKTTRRASTCKCEPACV